MRGATAAAGGQFKMEQPNVRSDLRTLQRSPPFGGVTDHLESLADDGFVARELALAETFAIPVALHLN